MTKAKWGPPIYGDGGQVAVKNWGLVAYNRANALSEELVGPSSTPPTAQSTLDFAMASAARQRQVRFAPVQGLRRFGAVDPVKVTDRLDGVLYAGLAASLGWGIGTLVSSKKGAGATWGLNALTLFVIGYGGYSFLATRRADG